MNPTLCQLPTCHQRGRHLPACDDEMCSGCLPRVADEGIVCSACADRAERWLAEIERLTPDARLVAAGQVRRGHGGTGGKPGSRSPANDDAMDAMDQSHAKLARHCIRIARHRGMRFHVPCLTDCVRPTPSQAHCSVCHETFGSVSGFDRHRRGGQCLDPATIPGIHRNERGIWRFDGGENRASAHRETPQTAERAELVPAGTPETAEEI